MDFVRFMKPFIDTVGLTPACIVALGCIWIFYRLLLREKDAAEKIAESLDANTALTVEVKTLIETWLRFVKDRG